MSRDRFRDSLAHFFRAHATGAGFQNVSGTVAFTQGLAHGCFDPQGVFLQIERIAQHHRNG